MVGLDSGLGVECETAVESAGGIALPPTSLMRARTIGQIATLIAGHLGGATTAAEAAPATAPTAEAASSVDLDAISDEDIDRLLGSEAEPEPAEATEGVRR